MNTLFIVILLGEGEEISSIGQPLKVFIPNVVCAERISIFFKAEQSLNTEAPTDITD